MELIKVTNNEDGKQVFSARELHEGLEIKTEFRHWFPRVCEYDFIENEDYTPLIFEHPPLNKQPTLDYTLTINMAKEISMLQRNDIGKKFRRYFIECERKLSEVSTSARDKLLLSLFSKDPVEVAAAHKKLVELETKPLLATIEEQEPKVNLYDRLINTEFTYTATQVGKCYGLGSAIKLNKILSENKICYKKGKTWYPYATVDNSWYRVLMNEFGTQLRFTGLGVVEISKLLDLPIDYNELNEVKDND